MNTPLKPKKSGKALLLKLGIAVVALGFLGLLGMIVTSHYALAIASYEVQKISGFSLSADLHSVNPFTGSADFQGLQMTNPGRFPAPDFVRFTEVRTKVSPFSLLSKRIEIEEVFIDLDSAAVVMTKEGDMNALVLANAFLGTNKTTAAAPASTKSSTAAIPPFIIKKLTLRINQAKYLDYQHGDGKPVVVKMAYERTFTDVTEADLTKTEIAITSDLSTKGAIFLAQAFGNSVLDPATYTNLAKGGFQVGQQVVEGAGSIVGGAAGKAGNVVGGAASAVGGLLNLGAKK